MVSAQAQRLPVWTLRGEGKGTCMDDTTLSELSVVECTHTDEMKNSSTDLHIFVRGHHNFVTLVVLVHELGPTAHAHGAVAASTEIRERGVPTEPFVSAGSDKNGGVPARPALVYVYVSSSFMTAPRLVLFLRQWSDAIIFS